MMVDIQKALAKINVVFGSTMTPKKKTNKKSVVAKKATTVKKTTRKRASTKKKTTITPIDSKALLRKDVLKKRDEEWDGSYVPVEVLYCFRWKCPKCKKNNFQEFSNVYADELYGPAWSAVGVTCDKCETHYNIREITGD